MSAERRPRLLIDMGVLGLGQALSQLLNVASLVLVARILGSYGFGIVQMGVVVGAYALLVAEMGLMSLGIREISRLDERAPLHAYVRTHLGLLTAMAVAVLAVGALLLPQLPFYRQAPVVFVLYLLCVLPQVYMLDWVSTGLQNMKWTSVFWVARSLLYAVLVFLLLPRAEGALGLSGLDWVPVYYLVAFVAADLLLAVQIRRLLGGGTLAPAWGPRAEWRRRLVDATPIGLAMVVMRVLMSVDVLMLGLLRDPETVGLYAAASKLIAVLLLGSHVAWKALLPRLSRYWSEERTLFDRQFARFAGLAVVVLLPLAVGGYRLGPALMDLVYGNRFAGSGALFPLLAVAYPLLTLGVFFGNGLIACDAQRAYLPRIGVAAVVMILLHLLLIPPHGAQGACWSVLSGSGLLAVLTGWRMRCSLGRPFWRATLAAMVAGTLLWFALGVRAPFFLKLLLGIVVYSAVALPGVWRLVRPRTVS